MADDSSQLSVRLSEEDLAGQAADMAELMQLRPLSEEGQIGPGRGVRPAHDLDRRWLAGICAWVDRPRMRSGRLRTRPDPDGRVHRQILKRDGTILMTSFRTVMMKPPGRACRIAA